MVTSIGHGLHLQSAQNDCQGGMRFLSLYMALITYKQLLFSLIDLHKYNYRLFLSIFNVKKITDYDDTCLANCKLTG